MLGVTTPNFEVHVFDLDHEGFDGLLVGMNFLRHFNFEVRPGDHQILLELISGDGRDRLRGVMPSSGSTGTSPSSRRSRSTSHPAGIADRRFDICAGTACRRR